MFKYVHRYPAAELLQWACTLEKAADEENAELAKTNLASWKDWAKQSTAGSAGQAHRWTKVQMG